MRAGVGILGNLHGIRSPVPVGVVSIRRRAASTARSGACVGPASSHDRAARSSERSSVMRVVLPGRRAPRRPSGRRGARGWRSAVAIGPCPRGSRASRRSPPAAARGSGAGRRPPADRPAAGGMPAPARRGRRRPRCRPGSTARRWAGPERSPSSARPLRLVVAGVDEDPMDPGLESVRLPQVRDPAPGEHEGVLQRVLGETRVAQDPVGDRVERIADLVHQDGERLAIAPTGLLDEVSIHLDLRWAATMAARITHYDGRSWRERSGAFSGRRSRSAARAGPRRANGRGRPGRSVAGPRRAGTRRARGGRGWPRSPR